MKQIDTRAISRRWILRQVLSGVGLVCVTAFVLLFHFINHYDLAVGDVSGRSIRAPQDITYQSAILTQQAREQAIRQVSLVYTNPDPEIARQQLLRLRQVSEFISAVRADAYALDAQKGHWILAVSELEDLAPSDVNTLLSLAGVSWSRVQLEAQSLLVQIMRQEEIRQGNLAAIEERIPVQVPLDLPQDEANLVAALVHRLVKPNVFYDQEATEGRRLQAAEESESIFRTIRNGESIVREGGVITPLELELLEQLGLTTSERNWRDVGLAVALALGLTVLLGLYLAKLRPSLLASARLEGLTLLLLLLFLLLARLLLPAGPLLLYIFPIAALGMLVASTTDVITAIGVVCYVALIGGWINGQSLLIAFLLATNGITAALVLPRYEQAASIFRAGILGGLAGAGVRLVSATGGGEAVLLALSLDTGASLAGGIIAGGLTLGGLFLLAPLFDLSTTFRLLELSYPNHPLLQRLLREAPGTFHHTMMVASLAEQAAEQIGANVLLTRAGTYYHDIGKLARPYFFVENQEGLSNPHDRLDPLTSVDIITGHIRDGVRIARQYRLPSQVRAFITEHHGTALIAYFYHKAVQVAGGEEGLVERDAFRYSGPRPQSRETALVMLADGCEAATRAARTSSPEKLRQVIDGVFRARVKDGQLDECPLTLRELSMVQETYFGVLRGAYHPRIQYPQESEKTEVQA
ncbi:MAG: HDIG domain-containing protein [Chloroflexota bacterium]|nr:HDIG domain-containing protein [Chloroflexota bacterium]